MGYIKEPKNIDFLIKSSPLTDKERKAISEYIRKYKSKKIIKRKKKMKKETV